MYAVHFLKQNDVVLQTLPFIGTMRRRQWRFRTLRTRKAFAFSLFLCSNYSSLIGSRLVRQSLKTGRLTDARRFGRISLF